MTPPAAQETRAARLARYLSGLPRGFSWAHNNCCHFAARWVAAETGLQPMARLPQTATARQAAQLVRFLGGMRSAWSAALGREPIDAAYARTGDLVLIEGGVMPGVAPRGAVVGVCSGRHAAALAQDGCVAFVALEMASCAWRID